MGTREQELGGPQKVAEWLGYPVETVWQWRYRGILPDPDVQITRKAPAWRRGKIERWARETGRDDRMPKEEGAYFDQLERRDDAAARIAPHVGKEEQQQ